MALLEQVTEEAYEGTASIGEGTRNLCEWPLET